MQHSDCRVYDKNGKLIRIETMAERYEAKYDGAWFRCKICNHTLNIHMGCDQCNSNGGKK